MISKEKLFITLSKYISSEAAKLIALRVVKYNVSLKISSPRKTKFRDYRVPFNGKEHRILGADTKGKKIFR
ncbi:MAG: hypothetical protein ACI81S_002182 [Sphingobacteriales bacterium]|jgi:hypothetical protein